MLFLAVCPPPPVALCPPPHPIYLPSSNCDCGAANAPASSYASPGSAVGGYASPVPPPPLPPPPLLPAPPSSSYSSYRPNVQMIRGTPSIWLYNKMTLIPACITLISVCTTCIHVPQKDK
ncbi:unnamed protein product [Onchocerca flexuosa]|uniref:Uncharacterized protein n=1 Tax=Onchocerca flexuosa TaxID=387005 RepID=A0A183HYW4_9BILA|nr:unnamed protein product [Onchocerca flexuosa]